MRLATWRYLPDKIDLPADYDGLEAGIVLCTSSSCCSLVWGRVAVHLCYLVAASTAQNFFNDYRPIFVYLMVRL